MGKSFKAPIVVEPDCKSDKELDKLVENAREQFLNMQNSWWSFAKIIYQIKETEAFRAVADTFKDYCGKEFPSMSYETLTKFCHIVENFQDVIDHRIEKDPDYSLPAYESCYRLTTLKPEAVPKEEISKLKKSVLDGKMTYASLKDRIKEVMSKVKDKAHRDVEIRADRVEEQLLKDLSDEGFYDDETEEFEDSDDVVLPSSDGDDDLEMEEASVSNRNVKSVLTNINAKMLFIKDNLPQVTAHLDRVKITDDIIEIAENLEESVTAIEEFLEKLEEVSNV
jgi:archaellum component FlaC